MCQEWSQWGTQSKWGGSKNYLPVRGRQWRSSFGRILGWQLTKVLETGWNEGHGILSLMRPFPVLSSSSEMKLLNAWNSWSYWISCWKYWRHVIMGAVCWKWNSLNTGEETGRKQGEGSHENHRTWVQDFRLPEGQKFSFLDECNFPLLWVNYVPSKNVGWRPKPSTSECNLIWKYGLCRSNEIKIEVIRVVPNPIWLVFL